MKLKKIVSGGQTGADRAGLDWAIGNNFPHGGWCPKNRWAEDGIIDQKYDLTETPSEDYPQRTEWNVRDSDGTVIFSVSEHLSGGTLLTMNLAQKLDKPVIHICKEEIDTDHHSALKGFLDFYGIEILNIAGPRHSSEPGVYEFVTDVLNKVINGNTTTF